MKIVYRENADPDLIKKLEERLGTAAVQEDPADPLEAYLLLDSEGLSLNRGPLSMEGSFSGMKKRLKKSNLEHELILRAVRIREKKTLRILDATAGMGEDALLLSACGHKLDLYEKDPVIGSLLEDAVRRGTEDPDLKDAASRMAVHLKDSVEDMRIAGGRYDVICLDPMFPKRTKSADVKKKFQLIHELEQPCKDEALLLRAAILGAPLKIVIKRPVKGPYLAGVKPDYSLSGKAVRYDVLINLAAKKALLSEFDGREGLDGQESPARSGLTEVTE